MPDQSDSYAPPVDGGVSPKPVALDRSPKLVQTGIALECVTLTWNVVGVVVLAIAALRARSVALAGFGIDSLIEIGASAIVVGELAGRGIHGRRAVRVIGVMFVGLALYLAVQSSVVLATGFHAKHSPIGIGWVSATAVVMFALALGKSRVGRALQNDVLLTEGKVTLVDGMLATSVLLGLALNTTLGAWWADPCAGYVLVYYAQREARAAIRGS